MIFLDLLYLLKFLYKYYVIILFLFINNSLKKLFSLILSRENNVFLFYAFYIT